MSWYWVQFVSALQLDVELALLATVAVVAIVANHDTLRGVIRVEKVDTGLFLVVVAHDEAPIVQFVLCASLVDL